MITVYILYMLIENVSVEHPFYFVTKEECRAAGAKIEKPYEDYRCVVDYVNQ